MSGRNQYPRSTREDYDALFMASSLMESGLRADESAPTLSDFLQCTNRQCIEPDMTSDAHFSANQGFNYEQFLHLPRQILSIYREDSATSMGLFPELNRAWIAIDNRFFIWNYTHGEEFTEYDYFDDGDVVVSVALTTPKTGIFKQNIHYLVIIATLSEICIFAFDRESNKLLKTNCSLTTDGIVYKVQGSQSGLVFMAGSDGTLCRFDYYRESLLDQLYNQFSPGDTVLGTLKCTKVHMGYWDERFIRFIPRFMRPPSNVTDIRATNSIADLVVDDLRGIFYSLSYQGSLNYALILDTSHKEARMASFVDTLPLVGPLLNSHAKNNASLSTRKVDIFTLCEDWIQKQSGGDPNQLAQLRKQYLEVGDSKDQNNNSNTYELRTVTETTLFAAAPGLSAVRLFVVPISESTDVHAVVILNNGTRVYLQVINTDPNNVEQFVYDPFDRHIATTHYSEMRVVNLMGSPLNPQDDVNTGKRRGESCIEGYVHHAYYSQGVYLTASAKKHGKTGSLLGICSHNNTSTSTEVRKSIEAMYKMNLVQSFVQDIREDSSFITSNSFLHRLQVAYYTSATPSEIEEHLPIFGKVPLPKFMPNASIVGPTAPKLPATAGADFECYYGRGLNRNFDCAAIQLPELASQYNCIPQPQLVIPLNDLPSLKPSCINLHNRRRILCLENSGLHILSKFRPIDRVFRVMYAALQAPSQDNEDSRGPYNPRNNAGSNNRQRNASTAGLERQEALRGLWREFDEKEVISMCLGIITGYPQDIFIPSTMKVDEGLQSFRTETLPSHLLGYDNGRLLIGHLRENRAKYDKDPPDLLLPRGLITLPERLTLEHAPYQYVPSDMCTAVHSFIGRVLRPFWLQRIGRSDTLYRPSYLKGHHMADEFQWRVRNKLLNKEFYLHNQEVGPGVRKNTNLLFNIKEEVNPEERDVSVAVIWNPICLHNAVSALTETEKFIGRHFDYAVQSTPLTDQQQEDLLIKNAYLRAHTASTPGRRSRGSKNIFGLDGQPAEIYTDERVRIALEASHISSLHRLIVRTKEALIALRIIVTYIICQTELMKRVQLRRKKCVQLYEKKRGKCDDEEEELCSLIKKDAEDAERHCEVIEHAFDLSIIDQTSNPNMTLRSLVTQDDDAQAFSNMIRIGLKKIIASVQTKVKPWPDKYKEGMREDKVKERYNIPTLDPDGSHLMLAACHQIDKEVFKACNAFLDPMELVKVLRKKCPTYFSEGDKYDVKAFYVLYELHIDFNKTLHDQLNEGEGLYYQDYILAQIPTAQDLVVPSIPYDEEKEDERLDVVAENLYRACEYWRHASHIDCSPLNSVLGTYVRLLAEIGSEKALTILVKLCLKTALNYYQTDPLRDDSEDESLCLYHRGSQLNDTDKDVYAKACYSYLVNVIVDRQSTHTKHWTVEMRAGMLFTALQSEATCQDTRLLEIICEGLDGTFTEELLLELPGAHACAHVEDYLFRKNKQLLFKWYIRHSQHTQGMNLMVDLAFVDDNTISIEYRLLCLRRALSVAMSTEDRSAIKKMVRLAIIQRDAMVAILELYQREGIMLQVPVDYDDNINTTIDDYDVNGLSCPGPEDIDEEYAKLRRHYGDKVGYEDSLPADIAHVLATEPGIMVRDPQDFFVHNSKKEKEWREKGFMKRSAHFQEDKNHKRTKSDDNNSNTDKDGEEVDEEVDFVRYMTDNKVNRAQRAQSSLDKLKFIMVSEEQWCTDYFDIMKELKVWSINLRLIGVLGVDQVPEGDEEMVTELWRSFISEIIPDVHSQHFQGLEMWFLPFREQLEGLCVLLNNGSDPEIYKLPEEDDLSVNYNSNEDVIDDTMGDILPYAPLLVELEALAIHIDGVLVDYTGPLDFNQPQILSSTNPANNENILISQSWVANILLSSRIRPIEVVSAYIHVFWNKSLGFSPEKIIKVLDSLCSVLSIWVESSNNDADGNNVNTMDLRKAIRSKEMSNWLEALRYQISDMSGRSLDSLTQQRFDNITRSFKRLLEACDQFSFR